VQAEASTDDGLLVYARQFPATGDSALCVTDPQGTRTAILRLFDEQSVYEPVWAPDGNRIAFQRENEIVITNLDGTEESVVAEGIHPSWSPDGSQLAFERDGEVNVINSDATNQRVIGPGRDPDWSPDGSRLVFDRFPDPYATDGPEGELSTMDLSGDDVVDLGYGMGAAWSPDGTQLAYKDQSYWSTVLEVMSADGTARHTIVNGQYGGARPGSPSWSPDGTRIVYAQGAALMMINADGTDPHVVVHRGGEADWGAGPTDTSKVWDGPSCDQEVPRLFVSLRLHGHLFARGKVWTNDVDRCKVSGITVSVWRRSDSGLSFAGTDRTDEQGRYSMELRVQRRAGPRADRPGRYRAHLNAVASDCKRSTSHWKVHRH
jgi:TolB protein